MKHDGVMINTTTLIEEIVCLSLLVFVLELAVYTSVVSHFRLWQAIRYKCHFRYHRLKALQVFGSEVNI